MLLRYHCLSARKYIQHGEMVNMDSADEEIKACVITALEDRRFSKYEVIATGTTEKYDGYASHVNFATVLATTEEGVEENIELAVKSSRQSLIGSSRDIYKRESYIYETILPEFIRFQIQNNVKEVFNSFPKYYKSISNETTEAMVMENMKKSGYELYDCKKPLDLNHLKLVLREYGKLHAVSFAFKHKNREDFEKLVAGFNDVMLQFFIGFLGEHVDELFERACDTVNEEDKKKLSEVLQRGANDALVEIMNTVEHDSAILHGDCWSNNFLYKYEAGDHKHPLKVALLDWQISRLHSPVLDLSYLIYSTGSEEQLKHLDELLDIYYSSFSTFLKELGCDPDELFPYSTLRRHWKQYSLFGVVFLITFLHLVLCDKEEVPDLNESKDTEDFVGKIFEVKVNKESGYWKRVSVALNHYCNYSYP